MERPRRLAAYTFKEKHSLFLRSKANPKRHAAPPDHPQPSGYPQAQARRFALERGLRWRAPHGVLRAHSVSAIQTVLSILNENSRFICVALNLAKE